MAVGFSVISHDFHQFLRTLQTVYFGSFTEIKTQTNEGALTH